MLEHSEEQFVTSNSLLDARELEVLDDDGRISSVVEVPVDNGRIFTVAEVLDADGWISMAERTN